MHDDLRDWFLDSFTVDPHLLLNAAILKRYLRRRGCRCLLERREPEAGVFVSVFEVDVTDGEGRELSLYPAIVEYDDYDDLTFARFEGPDGVDDFGVAADDYDPDEYGEWFRRNGDGVCVSSGDCDGDADTDDRHAGDDDQRGLGDLAQEVHGSSSVPAGLSPPLLSAAETTLRIAESALRVVPRRAATESVS